MHVKATTLVTLLGRSVESVAADGEDALIVRFSNDETLTIIVDNAPYERFTVNDPDRGPPGPGSGKKFITQNGIATSVSKRPPSHTAMRSLKRSAPVSSGFTLSR